MPIFSLSQCPIFEKRVRGLVLVGFVLELVGWLVMLAELAAGILVLIGPFTNDLITRLGGLGAVPVMVGAISMVHWGQWTFMATDGGCPAGGIAVRSVTT